MRKIIIIHMLFSFIAITLIGCGGITISFNSEDKSTQREIKQDEDSQGNKDGPNTANKTNQNESKELQNAEDKANITGDAPQTQNKKEIIVIRDPIPVDISNGGFIFPNSDYTYLTKNQVANLNNYQLGIARNEIYARHGYIFSLEQFKSYFTAQSWYTPITKDVTLNDIETYNVNLIKAEEDRRGIKWS